MTSAHVSPNENGRKPLAGQWGLFKLFTSRRDCGPICRRFNGLGDEPPRQGAHHTTNSAPSFLGTGSFRKVMYCGIPSAYGG